MSKVMLDKGAKLFMSMVREEEASHRAKKGTMSIDEPVEREYSLDEALRLMNDVLHEEAKKARSAHCRAEDGSSASRMRTIHLETLIAQTRDAMAKSATPTHPLFAFQYHEKRKTIKADKTERRQLADNLVQRLFGENTATKEQITEVLVDNYSAQDLSVINDYLDTLPTGQEHLDANIVLLTNAIVTNDPMALEHVVTVITNSNRFRP